MKAKPIRKVSLVPQRRFSEEVRKKVVKKVSNHILKLYNDEQPHSNLHKMTPIGFENSVEKLPLKERPKEVIFKWDHQLSTKSDLLTKRKK